METAARRAIVATRPGGASASRSILRKSDLLDAKRPGHWRASAASAIEIPKGETAANRSDIEVFFDQLPEPIDLELDLKNRVLYWTDRGDPPRGNTVNRASIDARPQAPEIVLTHLMEGIGIALDVAGDRMFVSDFGAGSLYSARLDGSGERNFLFAQGNVTGIAYAEIEIRPQAEPSWASSPSDKRWLDRARRHRRKALARSSFRWAHVHAQADSPR